MNLFQKFILLMSLCSILVFTEESAHYLQSIGKLDHVFIFGPNKQSLFFLSEQTKTYGYLKTSDRSIQATVDYSNDKFVRIHKQLKKVDFISQNFTLYTLDYQNRNIRVHEFKLDSDLKQKITSFSVIDQSLYLLLENSQVLFISGPSSSARTIQTAKNNEKILSIVPYFQWASQEPHELIVVSITKPQTGPLLQSSINTYCEGNLRRSGQDQLLNNQISKIYLNRYSLVIQGDINTFVYFNRVDRGKVFNFKTSQYFTNDFIFDDFSYFRPMDSAKFDFIKAQCRSELKRLIKSGLAIYRDEKFYEIGFLGQAIKKIARDPNNQIRRSWYEQENNDNIMLITQTEDNTVSYYVMDKVKNFVAITQVKLSWQIKGLINASNDNKNNSNDNNNDKDIQSEGEQDWNEL